MPHKVWHHDDTQYTEEELRNLESVQSRIRISLTDPAPGEQYPTVHAWHMNFARIPVFQVDFHEDNQSFSVALGKEGPEMTWLPTATGAPEWQLTPGHADGYEPEDIRTTPIADEWFPTVETYPADAETHWSDAVLVFPLDSGIPPIYMVYHTINRDIRFISAPDGDPALPAFPDAKRVKSKTSVQGGGSKRRRWKDKRQIYEWDSQHGKVEVYDKNGKHIGEFDHITGEQTKPKDPSRRIEK
ncbi:colicin E3/pyocin S6 family cytotoxin [Photobacterium sp. 1_MG-2023]|uniref:colicin E3/pyocin S6 family cytotoxin n=1 Tax=Photobacterium sp. 1_MG-2023 TaxID=3062646 RepID=UPI0026E2E1FF|nr:colicin E3/pyocin S6 family cytotoxin [Photobacterium sp. 1_MG-2023]MDO6708620.1 colicin E3/pyocin S6 family cytotoxin [Photobacterium sp. 1_MG-2023]